MTRDWRREADKEKLCSDILNGGTLAIETCASKGHQYLLAPDLQKKNGTSTSQPICLPASHHYVERDAGRKETGEQPPTDSDTEQATDPYRS